MGSMHIDPGTVGLARIHERAHQDLVERNRDSDWPTLRSDAIQLSLLVRILVDQVHAFNKGHSKPGQDLCPLCASYTWGRPMLADEADAPLVQTPRGMVPDRHDYTRRQCHVCDTIRPEPEEEVG